MNAFASRHAGHDPATTRYSLLSRLHNWDDQESWKEFFETYWRLIYSFALKSGLARCEAEDVVQETIICVARDIEKFKRDRELGSFKNWLRTIAHWRIIDQLRKRSVLDASVDEADWEEIPDSHAPDLESYWEAEWQANLLTTAIDRVKRRVKEEHFQIFDLCALRQVPVSRITETLGVSLAQVYVVKHRISALIKKEIKALEARLP